MLDQFLQQLANISWIEWLGMATGITGVWLSIKEKVAGWPFFILCYACYVYISYQYSLFAFLAMNVIFIVISIFGWLNWRKPESGLGIRRMPKKHWPILIGCLLLSTTVVSWALSINSEASVPLLDALAACSGLTAQWLLSRKRIETWLFWLISDLLYLGIFIYAQSWPSAILFTLFTGLALKGWREWHTSLKPLKS